MLKGYEWLVFTRDRLVRIILLVLLSYLVVYVLRLSKASFVPIIDLKFHNNIVVFKHNLVLKCLKL
jgi:hypothetical protein